MYSDAPPADTRSKPAPAVAGSPRQEVGILLLLGAALLATAYHAGALRLDAPWMQGDEYMFIVNNPDVTGAGRPAPLIVRGARLFAKVHNDLYQPIPILTYMIEWSIWSEASAFFVRQDDLFIHGVNALLLWSVLACLIRRFAPRSAAPAMYLAWALALLWALHPALVRAYAADMGRTHLLSATFSLLAVRCYLWSAASGRALPVLLTLVTLVLALMSKPMVTWIVPVVALEWTSRGLRRTLRSPRIYLLAIVCAIFAGLTVLTSSREHLLDEIGGALFGDPLTRSCVAAFLYAKSSVWPIDLTIWHLPDIQTAWDYSRVWIGLGIGAATLLFAFVALPRNRGGLVGVGLIWFWAILLPVIGLVGARFSAAGDRYLYQPLMGLMMALAGVVLWSAAGRSPLVQKRVYAATTVGVALVALLLLPRTRAFCGVARSTLGRATNVVAHGPDDPRVYEMLGAAYTFVGNNPENADDGRKPDDHYELAADAFARAGELAKAHPEYFSNRRARLGFYRRLAFELFKLGDARQSLLQAQRALTIDPDSPETYTLMATAYRTMEQWDEAWACYMKLEELMTADYAFRALRYTEFGDLLLQHYENPAEALPRYRKAVELGGASPRARLGLARCEVLAGDRERGLQIAAEILAADDDNVDAALSVALYHVVTGNWHIADQAYRAILRREPDNYEALRGFHEVCAQSGAWREAAFAWQTARESDPDDPIFESYFVWAAACANEAEAPDWARRILSRRANDPFACYAQMLFALRAAKIDDALEWIERAARGGPHPKAHETRRVEKSLELMIARRELGSVARLALAAISLELNDPAYARTTIEAFLEESPSTEHRATAEQLLARTRKPLPKP